MNNAPVVVFAYNRKDKVERCLQALETNLECNKTILYLFADGAKSKKDEKEVIAVRDYIKKIYMPKSKFLKVNLVESEYNKGLANSIIGGVTEVINQYGRAIVVEDDLVVAQDFLKYMNSALDYYENISQIGSISAYTVPIKALKRYKKDVYMLRKGECWGWATWKNRWQNVDWEVTTFETYKKNKNMRKEFDSIGYGFDSMLCEYMEGSLDAWAVRWCYHLYTKGLLTVYPRVSRVINVGLDGTGTHCSGRTRRYFHRAIGSELMPVYEIQDMNTKLERATWNYEAGAIFSIERLQACIRRMFGSA